MSDYKVKLEVFEGPLDLLLYLVKKAEVDIYHIPIVEITDQYLKYIELMKMLDLEIAGEFLWMASNLIYIKSKTLLPPEERQEDEEEELDPQSELIRQLIEYKKFKEVADALGKLEEARCLYFPKEAIREEDLPEPSLNLGQVSLFDLLSAFSQVLQKVEVRDNLKKIFEEEVSVEHKIDLIEKMITLTASFAFQELFLNASSRMEIVATFLALLELIRLKKVRVLQEGIFGNILIQRAVHHAV